MARDPRYDVLFEPVRIGPVISKNRFYQVPHCNGTGDSSPRMLAGMREIKAEGGWGVVCTENLMIDITSDIAPFPAVRLWSNDDIPTQELMVEGVHKHGALAGCELAHFGIAASNRNTREVPIGPSSRMTMEAIDPRQSRRMTKTDIKQFRRRHRKAALRAKQAGFDIVYVYCSLENSIIAQYFSSVINDRSDEYGGNFNNRTRLFRELLDDTLDAVGDHCAVAIRMPAAQFTSNKIIENIELKDIIESQANVPDLWDVNINDWSHDSSTSRFDKEGYQEEHIRFVKTITSKPVVGVGRFTSPETMLSQIKHGIIDFIGAARPSIADPFLPKKIEQGHEGEIRECIGCNICISGENSFTPMRCTQNPTIMEEWRRGWHPETIRPISVSDQSALIIGGGPAGLECALMLARTGFSVQLAESARHWGGRILKESQLPGLSEWIRVRDYRLNQLQKMNNVELYLESTMHVDDIVAIDPMYTICATGATWRHDGLGRQHYIPLSNVSQKSLYTPDDVMNGIEINGPIVIYDDDGGYLSSAIAEKFAQESKPVQIITPHDTFARWTKLTLEQNRLISRMREENISLKMSKVLIQFSDGIAQFKCLLTNQIENVEAQSLVLITSKQSNDHLYNEIQMHMSKIKKAPSIYCIGDSNAPGLIADAVFSGHLLARQLSESKIDGSQIKREYSI